MLHADRRRNVAPRTVRGEKTRSPYAAGRWSPIRQPGVLAALAPVGVSVSRPKERRRRARNRELVGATAHYVTPDLDEGPIIAQQVIEVDHSHTPDDLVLVGRDAESAALSQAVRWHCEDRVFVHNARTVVLR